MHAHTGCLQPVAHAAVRACGCALCGCLLLNLFVVAFAFAPLSHWDSVIIKAGYPPAPPLITIEAKGRRAEDGGRRKGYRESEAAVMKVMTRR